MNPVIKRELEKVRAPLPEYDDNTTRIDIPKKEVATAIPLLPNKCYLVELADYILHEPPNFTLSSNWNKGFKPVSKHLIINVIQIVGNMVQVDGSGYQLLAQQSSNDVYHGFWLPIQGLTIIQEIK